MLAIHWRKIIYLYRSQYAGKDRFMHHLFICSRRCIQSFHAHRMEVRGVLYAARHALLSSLQNQRKDTGKKTRNSSLKMRSSRSLFYCEEQREAAGLWLPLVNNSIPNQPIFFFFLLKLEVHYLYIFMCFGSWQGILAALCQSIWKAVGIQCLHLINIQSYVIQHLLNPKG